MTTDQPSPATYLRDGPDDAAITLALAHGAGAGMDSPFMQAVAEGLGRAGIRVVRFEFPYMEARRRTGAKRPPDREPKLRATWARVIADLRAEQAQGGKPGLLAIGGKSMGGRMASLVADEHRVGALVCLGYPFHAPGKPEKPRTAHLEAIATPTLIVQGTRDPFGKPDEVAGYGLGANVRVDWIDSGDHDMKPLKSSGRTHEQTIAETVEHVAAFLTDIHKRS